MEIKIDYLCYYGKSFLADALQIPEDQVEFTIEKCEHDEIEYSVTIKNKEIKNIDPKIIEELKKIIKIFFAYSTI